jgi:hypothetical protein
MLGFHPTIVGSNDILERNHLSKLEQRTRRNIGVPTIDYATSLSLRHPALDVQQQLRPWQWHNGIKYINR